MKTVILISILYLGLVSVAFAGNFLAERNGALMTFITPSGTQLFVLSTSGIFTLGQSLLGGQDVLG